MSCFAIVGIDPGRRLLLCVGAGQAGRKSSIGNGSPVGMLLPQECSSSLDNADDLPEVDMADRFARTLA